jgi:hypothetical protein
MKDIIAELDKKKQLLVNLMLLVLTSLTVVVYAFRLSATLH